MTIRHDPDRKLESSGPTSRRADVPVAASERGSTWVPAVLGMYRDLGAIGLAPREAGNLTAYVRGIRPAEGGWTVAEIDRLLFLRYLVDRGRIGS